MKQPEHDSNGDASVLQKLATIFRDADTSALISRRNVEVCSQSPGADLAHSFKDDHEKLNHGLVIQDAHSACSNRITPKRTTGHASAAHAQ
ncbi:MAG: hypothetical protein IPK83_14170 [Planctomycetes bacterium]|nr:hypothetical protein [Planctomycetota bacterium]